MSAFLGKIHYWLYGKILLHEELINAVVEAATAKGYSGQSLLNESYEKYGEPITGPLEDYINHSNIHGWLQERINSVEKRLAFIVTELLAKGILTEEEIESIFIENGVNASKDITAGDFKAQDLYQLIFNHMLEGMPCDRVSQFMENTDDVFSWKTTSCLHKEHWDQVGGDVSNFYRFRDSWIQGFFHGIGAEYSYSSADGINTIRRV